MTKQATAQQYADILAAERERRLKEFVPTIILDLSTQVRGSVPSRNLPDASGTDRGAVVLSDDDPAAVVTTGADPGAAADVSRGDHVHALTPTAVTPGAYGDATHIPTFTVGADGRLTLAGSVLGGFGFGSVTSVALTAPSILSVGGSPITGAGTLALTLATQSANTVFAGPSSGGAATPAFRALTAADLPATAVAAGSYGSASQVGTFTVDAAGRLTAAANVAITLPASAITSGEIPRSPLTTRGDLLTQNPNGTHTRLAIGAAGRYLRSDGTDPSWAQPLFSDLVFSGLTTGQPLRATSATAAAFGALDLANANAVTGLLVGTNGGTGVNNGSSTLTIGANTTITGGGTLALGGFNATAPATGTMALLGTANVFTALQTIDATSPALDWKGSAQQWRAQLDHTTGDQWALYDVTNNRTPLIVAAGAPSNSLKINSSGAIVLGTVLDSTYGGTGTDNGGRTLAITTNSGAIAFSAASKTLTVAKSIALDGVDGKTLTLNINATIDSGTYTPTYSGSTTAGAPTYTTQDGYWRRVADIVFFNGRITWTASGTAAGNAQISLPFTAATAAAGTYRWSGSLWVNNVTIGAFNPMMLITGGGTSFIMSTPANNGAAVTIAVEAAGDVIFSGWFYV